MTNVIELVSANEERQRDEVMVDALEDRLFKEEMKELKYI